MVLVPPEESPAARKPFPRASAAVVEPVPPLPTGRVPVTPPEPLAARCDASALTTPAVKVIPVPATSDLRAYLGSRPSPAFHVLRTINVWGSDLTGLLPWCQ